MNEWTGKLSRIDAIMIIERATDKEDPAWLWSVEDWYDEDTDTWPSIYHVMAALDVTESEYREATGAQNLNWPDEGDSELTTLVRQLAEREKTEQDLWEKLNCQDNEIDDLKRQLAEAQEKAFKAGYHTGHGHTVEGRFQWCGEGTDDVYRDWLQDIAAEAQQENPNERPGHDAGRTQ